MTGPTIMIVAFFKMSPACQHDHTFASVPVRVKKILGQTGGSMNSNSCGELLLEESFPLYHMNFGLDGNAWRFGKVTASSPLMEVGTLWCTNTPVFL
jgi:hypothetical protein